MTETPKKPIRIVLSNTYYEEYIRVFGIWDLIESIEQ